MQRVMILGNAGSGKSTLARALGSRLGMTVVHLDPLFWEPGWIESDPAKFREKVRTSLEVDRWVCEGNYARRTFDLRLPKADLVIWLDTPRLVCLLRVIKRNIMRHPRPDLPIGCKESFDRKFLKFLEYVWQFDRVTRQVIEAKRLSISPQTPVVHLSGTGQISAYLESLMKPEGTQF